MSLPSHYGVLNPECVGQGQHRVIWYNARQSWPLLHADVHRTPWPGRRRTTHWRAADPEASLGARAQRARHSCRHPCEAECTQPSTDPGVSVGRRAGRRGNLKGWVVIWREIGLAEWECLNPKRLRNIHHQVSTSDHHDCSLPQAHPNCDSSGYKRSLNQLQEIHL